LEAPKSARDRAKYAAALKAVEVYVRDGMKVGLGSGTTSHWFVRALGERVHSGLSVAGVPTSTPTRDLALECRIPLVDLNDVDQIDLTIDGADEIDPRGDMIKGGGASLLREKIVAYASKRMVVVLDESKRVDVLGAFPLPVEVIPFGWKQTRQRLIRVFADMGYGSPSIDLRGGASRPIVTDSGNHILDCRLERIDDAPRLAPQLSDIPGVVEHGLFIGIADEMVVGHADGSTEIVPFHRNRRGGGSQP